MNAGHKGGKNEIVLVEDDERIRAMYVRILKDRGFQVNDAGSYEEAIELLESGMAPGPAVAVIDPNLQDHSDGLGLRLIPVLKERFPGCFIVVWTAYDTYELCEESIKLGADRFVPKADVDKFYEAIDEGVEFFHCIQDSDSKETQVPDSEIDKILIGKSPKMERTKRLVRQHACINTTGVLVRGETGTGKDLVARCIHVCGEWKEKPYIHCDMPNAHAVAESTLFGHEKGAFTNAIADHIGLFEQADGGILFLNEIGDAPLSIQPKLLRAVEYGTFRRIGGETDIGVNVRVISATNRELEKMVAAREFRDDLYYRIAKFMIEIPPLRERIEDIPALTEHFLEQTNRKFNTEKKGVSHQALQSLQEYHWPGNVRELGSAIEYAVFTGVAKSPFIELSDLPPSIIEQPKVAQPPSGLSEMSGAPRPKQTEAEDIWDQLKKGKKLWGLLFSLDLEFSEVLDGNVLEIVRQTFEQNGILLSRDATVSTEREGSIWLVTDNDQTYCIRKQEDKLNVHGSVSTNPLRDYEKEINNASLCMAMVIRAIIEKGTISDAIEYIGDYSNEKQRNTVRTWIQSSKGNKWGITKRKIKEGEFNDLLKKHFLHDPDLIANLRL